MSAEVLPSIAGRECRNALSGSDNFMIGEVSRCFRWEPVCFLTVLSRLNDPFMRKIFLLGSLAAAVSAGCRHRAAETAMPALSVETVLATADSIPNRMRFIGYLASNFDAVIQPRVNGFLSSKHYENGMPVRRGQLLFTIDPAQLSTTMLEAEATLESARAQASEARNNYERAVPLARIDAINQMQLDQYTAQYKATEAAVRSAEQSLNSARMNVGYTELRSPIDGIVEHTSAHVGDYVGPGTQFSVLTTVSNVDTLTVGISIPMVQYLRLAGTRRSIFDNGGLLSDIRMTLADGTEYPREGRYSYTQKNVQNTTGTLVLVVAFPNPDRTLKPGQFARVEANVGPARQRVVVPQQAVSQTQNISSVWVVDADSVVHYRRIVPGETYGSSWCVDEGLEAGERVVTSGRQKLHDGMKVVPVKR